MVIHFLRHAEAEDEVDSDFNRRLTTKGLEQAEKVGKFCVRSGLIPDVILSSPVVRARQTAEIVGKATGSTPVIEDWLACGMEPEMLYKKLAAHSEHDTVFLVGHEPDFSCAISSLLGVSDPSAILIRKASLTAVDAPWLEAGAGRLQFSIPARLM